MYDEIGFGRHANHTLPQVALMDPDYFFWLYAKSNALRRCPRLWRQAQRVYARSRRILPPDVYPEEGTAVLYLEHPDGGYGGLDIVPAAGPRRHVPPRGRLLAHIDLFVPRTMKRYDKLGAEALVSRMLRELGYGNPRRTRRFCEGFFDDDDNFDLEEAAA